MTPFWAGFLCGALIAPMVVIVALGVFVQFKRWS